MITDRELYVGLGTWLDAAGLATFDADGIYPTRPARPAVFFGPLPPAPDDAIAITRYNRDISRGGRGTPDVYVQLRYRTAGEDPTIVGDLADAVADLLDDRTHIDLPGGVRVLHALRVVNATATPDGTRRYEQPDSYRLTLTPR